MGWGGFFSKRPVPTNGATVKAPPPRPRDEDEDDDVFFTSFEMPGMGGRLEKSLFNETTKDMGSDGAGFTSIGSDQPASIVELEQFYANSIWVYAAIYQIAVNLAQVPMIAWQKVGEERQDAPTSALQDLLDRPHSRLSGFQFTQKWVTHLQSSGTGPVILERRGATLETTDQERLLNPEGPIVSMWPVLLSRITPDTKKGPKTEALIKSYLHQVEGKKTRIHPDNVMWPALEDPTNDIYGLAPGSVVRQDVNVDKKIIELNDRTVSNGGMPGVVLESDQKLTSKVAHRIMRRFMELFGRYNKHGTAAVLGSGLKVKPLGFSPRDMQFESQHRLTARRILAAFGVPPAMVMMFEEASVLANADAQRRIFFENTLMPIGRLLEDVFNQGIQRVGANGRPLDPRFGPLWGMRYAWEKVELLKGGDDLRRTSTRSDWQADGISLNEFRRETGREPVEDERGDQFFSQTRPDPFGGFAELSGPNTRRPIQTRAIQATDEFKRVSRASYSRLLRLWSGRMSGEMKKFFREQEMRILENIRELRPSEDQSPAKTLGVKAFSPEMLRLIFDRDQEALVMRRDIGPIFLSAFLDAGSLKLDQLLPEQLLFGMQRDTDRIRAFIDKWSATEVVRIQDETQKQLNRLVGESFSAGDDSFKLETEIKNLFEFMREGDEGAGSLQGRAERISRTEIGTALNTGGFEALKQVEDGGGQIVKSWLSSRDGLVRDTHVADDRITTNAPIPLGERFPSSGLLYPQEPGGPGGEVINCRCTTTERLLIEPQEQQA